MYGNSPLKPLDTIHASVYGIGMTTDIAPRTNRLTIRWVEADDNLFRAESGKQRVEVFPAPFKPGKWCWRRFRMNVYWRVQDGGIADTIEHAMSAAGTALAGGPKEWKAATREVVR